MSSPKTCRRKSSFVMQSLSTLFRSVCGQKVPTRISTNRLSGTASSKFRGLTKSTNSSRRGSTKSRTLIRYFTSRKRSKSLKSMQDCLNQWCRIMIRTQLPRYKANSSILSKYQRSSRKYPLSLSNLISQESDLSKKSATFSTIPKEPSLAWSSDNWLPSSTKSLTNHPIGEQS